MFSNFRCPARIFRLYREAFSGLNAAVWYLAIAMLVNRAGTMVLPFLGLYLVEERGLPATAASAVLASFGLGAIVGAWLGGRLSAALGPILVEELALVAAGVGFFAIAWLRSFEALVLGVFAVSALGEAFRPAAMTAIVTLAPGERRLRAFALLRLAANLGMAVGPAAGGVLATIDYLWLFVGDAATCWLAAAVLFVTLHRFNAPQTPRSAEERAAAGPPAWRDGPFLALLAGTLVMALVLFQVFSSLPVFLSAEYGLAEGRIGLLLALNGTLIVLFEMVLVKVLERRDTAKVLACGSLLLCLGYAVLPLGSSWWIAVTSIAIWTVGEMLTIPFLTDLVARRSERRGSGEYMGWLNATYSLALVLAPPIGLGIYGRFGGTALWTACGVIGPLLWLAFVRIGPRIGSTRPQATEPR